MKETIKRIVAGLAAFLIIVSIVVMFAGCASTRAEAKEVEDKVMYAVSRSAYIADVSMLSISSLAVGTSFIMIPQKTSTSIYCELNFCDSGLKPIRVRTANYNGTVDLPTHTEWLTQYKPVRMTYDGTYWVADVVNAATMTEVNSAIQAAIGNAIGGSY